MYKTKKCRFCGEFFTTEDYRQIFCNHSCAASFTNKTRKHSDIAKERISNSLKKWRAETAKQYEYICEGCEEKIFSTRKTRKGRKIHCKKCKRKVCRRINDAASIAQLSKRTMCKIVKRLNLSCFNCGWNDCVCDVHHIKPKSKGGTDDHTNLTYLCPNCHRKAHNNMIQNMKSLQEIVGDKWQSFYFN